jgi:hypothetical protein
MTVYNFTGTQTITGFNPTTDIVQESTQAISASQLTIGVNSTGVTITDPSGDVLTLAGISVNQLTHGNFNFVNGSTLTIGSGSAIPALNSSQAIAPTITGTGSDQVMAIGNSANILDSSTAGSNFIRGGAGTDTVSIGSGGANDTIVLGTGSGDSVNASSVSTGLVDIYAGNWAVYSGVGTSAGAAGTITGSLYGGLIKASTANDSIVLGAHSAGETVIGGHGNDTVTNGAATAPTLIEGGKGSDSITDSSATGHDTLAAGHIGVASSAGNGFAISGGTGSFNVYYGDGGNGSITTSAGINDTVYAGQGAVSITSATSGAGGISTGTGSLFEMNKGNDTWVSSASAGFDTVEGGSGTNVFDIVSGPADATTTAGRYIDVLAGSGTGTFNDTNAGPQGNISFVNDTTSGAGVDTYNILMSHTAAHADTISISNGLKSTDVVAVTDSSIDADTLAVTVSGSNFTTLLANPHCGFWRCRSMPLWLLGPRSIFSVADAMTS